MILLFCFNIGFIFFFHLLTVRIVVISLAHPAEVAGAVIQMVAISVVNGCLFFWIVVLAERHSNKSADKIMLALAILG